MDELPDWYFTDQQHGAAVVVFAPSADETCLVGRCILRVAWFPTYDEAQAAARQVPARYSAHLVTCAAPVPAPVG